MLCFDLHHIGISLPYRAALHSNTGRKMRDRLLWFGTGPTLHLTFYIQFTCQRVSQWYTRLSKITATTALIRRWITYLYCGSTTFTLRMRNAARRRLIAFLTLFTVGLRNALSFVWPPIFRSEFPWFLLILFGFLRLFNFLYLF